MAEKIISQQELKRILHYNPSTGQFINLVRRGSNAEIGSVAGWSNDEGYIYLTINGVSYKAHRLAWLYIHGEWPNEIDHKNRIKHDNRIKNLSNGTRSDNQHNILLRCTNKSGHRGVSFCKSANKWMANITVNRKRIYLGVYADINDAISARIAGEIAHR